MTDDPATGEGGDGGGVRAGLEASVALPLRSYLKGLSADCRRQLLDTLEEAAMRGSQVIGGAPEATVATLLGELERGVTDIEYPTLWRGVCFPAEHALTDAWEGLSRWDIPRPVLSALYTYVRVRLPEWSMLLAGFHGAPSGRARYLVLCAAMSLVGPFLTDHADDPVLLEALHHRTRLETDDILRAVRLFARLVTVGPGFLDTIGAAFDVSVEELTCLPLLPAELRRPFVFSPTAVRQVASRFARMPAAAENQNHLVATQTALLLGNPSEMLNLIPAALRRDDGLLAGSGFAAICEYVVARLERHARECRFFLPLWTAYGIGDVEYLAHARSVTEIVEQYDRESLALIRLVRIAPRGPWGERLRQAERDIIDALIHTALPVCWIGVQATSIYALLPMDKPRRLPAPHQLQNERQLFHFITAATSVIDRSNNRLALDNLRSTLSSFVNAMMGSIKPSWYLSYRLDRDDAIAMTGHFLCLLGALERAGDIRMLMQRLKQQRLPLAEVLPCGGNCGRACGDLVMKTRA